jgi:hypothetical protein
MNRRLVVLSVAAALAAGLGIGSADAHHSSTMFDHTKTVVLKGKVVEVRWVNPHVNLLVNGAVKDGDQPSDWLLETTSPGNLTRVSNWTRTSVKPGDNVIIEMSPLRDPEKQGGNLKKLTLVDTGEVFITNIRAQEEPGLE